MSVAYVNEPLETADPYSDRLAPVIPIRSAMRARQETLSDTAMAAIVIAFFSVMTIAAIVIVAQYLAI